MPSPLPSVRRVHAADARFFADVPSVAWLTTPVDLSVVAASDAEVPGAVYLSGHVLRCDADATLASCGGLLARLRTPPIAEHAQVRIRVSNA